MKTKSIDLEKKLISFSNGNQAQRVIAPAGAPAAEVLKALDIPAPRAVIVVSGGAGQIDQIDDIQKSRLIQLFSRGVARAAADAGAAIIDGGTQSGVMAMMGQGVADRGRKSVLLGVAPASKVTYPNGPAEGSIEDGGPLDPNHSHFALVERDGWGSETQLIVELAVELSQKKPVVTVLVGGGTIARDEVLRSVRQGWPVIVVEGSGGLADEVAKLVQDTPDFIVDPVLAEIVGDGNLYLFSLERSIEALRKLIVRRLGADETLQFAWQRFAAYDAQALRHQTDFHRRLLWILGLGVFTTFLVVFKTWLRTPGGIDRLTFLDEATRAGLANFVLRLDPWLSFVILILPITSSILLGIAARFNANNKWILLRGSSETIKQAIFVYRTRPAVRSTPQAIARADGQPETTPSEEQVEQATREAELARKVEFISRQLSQTDVNLSALPAYDGPIPPKNAAAKDDDGISFLTPDRYIALRLDDQLDFYQDRTLKKERELRRYQALTVIAGGVGTFLAAVGLDIWVALTTTLAAAFTTYLQYRQTENTLIQYNQTATNLQNVKGWWLALSADEQADRKNVNKLVEYTENILGTENNGWVQQMQDALAKLREEESGENTKPGGGTGAGAPGPVS